MVARSIDHDAAVVRMLQETPGFAEAYLQTAMEEIHQEQGVPAFLTALRQVVEAQGGIGELAHKTGLSREHLYRSISRRGNPTLSTLLLVTRAIGIQLKPISLHP